MREREPKAVGPKKIPPENLVSLEEILDDREEEDLDPNEKQHFTKDVDDQEEKKEEEKLEWQSIGVREALSELEKKDERLAGILKRRYYLDETFQKIGEYYGVEYQRIIELHKRALKRIKYFIENKKFAILAREQSLYSEQERDFIVMLAKDPRYQPNGLATARKIAEEVNLKFHKNRAPETIYEKIKKMTVKLKPPEIS